MKRIYKIASLLFLTALTVVSCFSGDLVVYGDQTMADVVNGQFITDTENIYVIEEDETDGKWIEKSRVFLFSDLLSTTEQGHIRIRLKHYEDVKTQPIIRSSYVDEYEAGNDTTILSNAWLGSNNRINLLVNYPTRTKENNDTFTIVYDEVNSNSDKMTLIVRRNSHGNHISTKEILTNNPKLDYVQVLFTASYNDFVANTNYLPQIYVMNGSNSAGNK